MKIHRNRLRKVGRIASQKEIETVNAVKRAKGHGDFSRAIKQLALPIRQLYKLPAKFKKHTLKRKKDNSPSLEKLFAMAGLK